MELAFWESMAVGNPGATLPAEVDLAGDVPMGKMSSMGFDEMLQWMQSDMGRGKDLAAPRSAAASPAPARVTSDRPPSFDLAGLLGGAAPLPPPAAPEAVAVEPPVPDSLLEGLAGSMLSSAGSGLQPPPPAAAASLVSQAPPAFDQQLVSPFEQQAMQVLPPLAPSPQPQPSLDSLDSLDSLGPSQNGPLAFTAQLQQQVQMPQPMSQEALMSLSAAAAAATATGGSLGSMAMSPMEVLQKQQELELQMLRDQQLLQQKQLEEFLARNAAAFPAAPAAFQPPQQFQFQEALQKTGAAAAGVSPSLSGESEALEELEQRVAAEIEGRGERPKQDILNVEMTELGLATLADQPPSSLYSQMLKTKAQRRGPQQRARTSARDRMNDLERQVAELQQEKATLTEETNNMQCRLNILDRMLQLRRENCEEVTDTNIRLDDTIQVAALVAETEELSTKQTANEEEKPKVKTLAKIFEREYSTATFDEMSGTWKGATGRMTEVMAELDKLPMGTDIAASPLVARLQDELNVIQSICSGYQTRGGGNLMLKWNQHVLKNALATNRTFTEEFVLNYQKIYPLLRLTPQQKDRIQLTSAIYERRFAEMYGERFEHEAEFKHVEPTDAHASLVDSCRLMMHNEDSLRAVRCYDVNIREGHMMFAIIVLRKILDSIQIARLIIASYPLPPCCITLAQVVAMDLKKTTGSDRSALMENELLSMCKPCHIAKTLSRRSSADGYLPTEPVEAPAST